MTIKRSLSTLSLAAVLFWPVLTSAAEQVSVLNYQLKFTNTSAETADNVHLKNPIPAGTAFYPGSLVVDGVAQTDAQDGDHAWFDGSELHFTWASVDPNQTHIMQYGVYPLSGTQEKDIQNQAVILPPDNADPETQTVVVQETFVCGNGKVEQNEVCDSGAANGQAGKCNQACTGMVAKAVIPKQTPPEESQQAPVASAPSTASGNGESGSVVPEPVVSSEPATPTVPVIENAQPTQPEPVVVSPEESAGVLAGLAGRVSGAYEEVAEVLANPAVQTTAIPSLSILALGNVAASAGYLTFFNYLYFLFTQPIALIARRRKDKFGVVYDSLTKLPLDLAAVRLKNSAGRIMQTRVTDSQGRYNFLTKAGDYSVEVDKLGYTFPTRLLAGVKEDLDYVELLGENKVSFKRDGLLSSNIPVDPKGDERTPDDVKRKVAFRKFQGAFALLTTLLSIGALVFYPSWEYLFMAAFQAATYLMFRRLSVKKLPPHTGKIMDTSGRPLVNAVVRIMDAKFNRVLETQVTDSQGRYAFLVGRGQFFLTANLAGYEQFKTETIDCSGRAKTSVIDRELKLKPATPPVKTKLPEMQKTGS
ncbi:MAG: carboxypeptidase regulatory-like domain-containing protein [Alphaproteobacteria bacterium]|nr:carboxypeptidase regulatory-like domain-containing protein [Alphaproteobacteria bacterium]